MDSNSKKPLVSVIIPTYNRGWIVGEAIDSVLKQDFHDYELIVVDDGSVDDTPAILNAYGKKISVLRQPNQGVSAARNRGIAAASGRLISFLDSDDLWLPGKARRQIHIMDSPVPSGITNEASMRAPPTPRVRRRARAIGVPG